MHWTQSGIIFSSLLFAASTASVVIKEVKFENQRQEAAARIVQNPQLLKQIGRTLRDNFVGDVPRDSFLFTCSEEGLSSAARVQAGCLDLDAGRVLYEIQELGDRYTRIVGQDELQDLMRLDQLGLGVALRASGVQDSQRTLSGPEGSGPLIAISRPGSGLQEGDRVLKINSKSTVGKPVFSAAEVLLRDDMEVLFEIDRSQDSGSQTLAIKVDRQVRKSDSVSFRRAVIDEKKVGYIRIRSFDGLSAASVEDAIVELGAMDEWVLDLRGNGGGLLQASQEIAGLFIAEGKDLVRVCNPKFGCDSLKPIIASSERQQGLGLLKPELWKAPVVVLVDSGSASASETLAVALRDRGNGIIVGDKTRGKAVVQSLFPLSDKIGLIVTTTKVSTIDGGVRCPDSAP